MVSLLWNVSAMWEEAIIALSAKGMTLVSESIGYYSNSLFQCALKGQTEGDIKGDKDQQAGSSLREQRDQVLDEEAEEDHSITERTADGPREGKWWSSCSTSLHYRVWVRWWRHRTQIVKLGAHLQDGYQVFGTQKQPQLIWKLINVNTALDPPPSYLYCKHDVTVQTC